MKKIETSYFTKESSILDSWATVAFYETIEGFLLSHNIEIADNWFSTTDGLLYGEASDGSTVGFCCRPCFDIESNNWVCYQIILQIYPPEQQNPFD